MARVPMGALRKALAEALQGASEARTLPMPSVGAAVSHAGLGGMAGGLIGAGLNEDDAEGFTEGAAIGAGGALGLRMAAPALARVGAGARTLREALAERMGAGGISEQAARRFQQNLDDDMAVREGFVEPRSNRSTFGETPEEDMRRALMREGANIDPRQARLGMSEAARLREALKEAFPDDASAFDSMSEDEIMDAAARLGAPGSPRPWLG